MPGKIKIESGLIYALVNDLGIHIYDQFCIQAGKDPKRKRNVKEEQEFQWVRVVVSENIARGFILTNYQPELAHALVEQMNLEEPGFADMLLEDILGQYKLTLAKSLADGWKAPEAPDQEALQSDLTVDSNKKAETQKIEPQLILYFVEQLGRLASVEFYKPEQRKELGAREVKQLQIIADIVSLAIARGFILTNYQPELAHALVEQMNREEPGFSDEQLRKMLYSYQACRKYSKAE